MDVSATKQDIGATQYSPAASATAQETPKQPQTFTRGSAMTNRYLTNEEAMREIRGAMETAESPPDPQSTQTTG
jgi:hypothetical protein